LCPKVQLSYLSYIVYVSDHLYTYIQLNNNVFLNITKWLSLTGTKWRKMIGEEPKVIDKMSINYGTS